MQIETGCIASLAVKAPYSDASGSSLEPRQIFTNNHASKPITAHQTLINSKHG